MTQQEIIKKWKTHRRYLLKVIELMPEDAFDFKPAKEVKSFKSQVSHLASWLRSHSRFVTGVEMDKPKTKNKLELLESLESFFDQFIDLLSKMEESTFALTLKLWYGDSTKWRILSVMDNHLAHHRGQMIMYLRLKGIKPPSYSGW